MTAFLGGCSTFSDPAYILCSLSRWTPRKLILCLTSLTQRAGKHLIHVEGRHCLLCQVLLRACGMDPAYSRKGVVLWLCNMSLAHNEKRTRKSMETRKEHTREICVRLNRITIQDRDCQRGGVRVLVMGTPHLVLKCMTMETIQYQMSSCVISIRILRLEYSRVVGNRKLELCYLLASKKVEFSAILFFA